MTIKALLALASQLSSDTPALDAELLLAHCLGRSRSYLYAWPEREVDDDCALRYRGLLARRAAGEPVAYLLGEREFWSLSLEVAPSTLIPRPETERLVEIALERIDAVLQARGERCADVLDLGTGTGAIALALAKERPCWRLCAVDVSREAVALARRNAERHGLSNVDIWQSDWLASVPVGRRFHAVVSNPPYIAGDDPHLEQGDVRFEPRTALVAANAGLADLARIATSSRAFLMDGGWLLCEHGADQGQAVRRQLITAGYDEVQTWRDYGNRERVSGGRVVRPEDSERSRGNG